MPVNVNSVFEVKALPLSISSVVHHVIWYPFHSILNAVKCSSRFSILSLIDLKPLLHASCNGPQVAVDLAGILAQDQAHNRLSCNVYVLEPAQDVNLGVGQDDACS